jgi:hypothetical protein
MFRYTIRELGLLILCCGLALGWWLDRHAFHTQAVEDARYLARCAAGGMDLDIQHYVQLQEKYGAKPR